jgi:hypothetical protein
MAKSRQLPNAMGTISSKTVAFAFASLDGKGHS